MNGNVVNSTDEESDNKSKKKPREKPYNAYDANDMRQILINSFHTLPAHPIGETKYLAAVVNCFSIEDQLLYKCIWKLVAHVCPDISLVQRLFESAFKSLTVNKLSACIDVMAYMIDRNELKVAHQYIPWAGDLRHRKDHQLRLYWNAYNAYLYCLMWKHSVESEDNETMQEYYFTIASISSQHSVTDCDQQLVHEYSVIDSINYVSVDSIVKCLAKMFAHYKQYDNGFKLLFKRIINKNNCNDAYCNLYEYYSLHNVWFESHMRHSLDVNHLAALDTALKRVQCFDVRIHLKKCCDQMPD